MDCWIEMENGDSLWALRALTGYLPASGIEQYVCPDLGVRGRASDRRVGVKEISFEAGGENAAVVSTPTRISTRRRPAFQTRAFTNECGL
jgi:hypothetical protein